MLKEKLPNTQQETNMKIKRFKMCNYFSFGVDARIGIFMKYLLKVLDSTKKEPPPLVVINAATVGKAARSYFYPPLQ